MFDGLRKDASDTSGFDEQPVEFFPEEKKPAPKPVRRRKATASSGKILGMTAPQRFLIAVMLMIAVCAMGAMCLLITGRFAF
ncbi:MAG: hypothetical protein ACOYZ6_10915 [Chloroflexota bacterium]